MRLVLPQATNSETMLAFQAPPDAVMSPVTHAPKIPGPMRARHLRQPLRPMLSAISRRSLGMLWAPAITLKSTYHWEPSAMSRMQPQLSEMCKARNIAMAKGKTKLVGKEARTWTTGCARRAKRGLKPMATPMGVQTRVLKMRRADYAAHGCEAEESCRAKFGYADFLQDETDRCADETDDGNDEDDVVRRGLSFVRPRRWARLSGQV